MVAVEESGHGSKHIPENAAESEECMPETAKVNDAAELPKGRNLQVKTVLLGEASVGKSSFVAKFIRGQRLHTEPTIGAAFFTQRLEIQGNTVKYDIWDTAGQERFHSLTPMYYRNAKAVIIAYDITKAVRLDIHVVANMTVIVI